MKSKVQLLLMIFLFSPNLLAEGLAQPQAPLLKEVASCFRSLPIGKRSKSRMQFYSEIIKSNGPDCRPLMLIVKDETERIPKLSVYRDNPNGKIEGLHVALPSRGTGSDYVRVGHPNGREDLTYTCQFTSKENIAQYGEQKRQQPLVINAKGQPPTILSDMKSPNIPKKAISSKYGYNEKALLRQIRTEISLRAKEMGSNARIPRDQHRGLESCLGLIVSREKTRDTEQKSDLEAETLLRQWLEKDPSPQRASDGKSIR